MTNNKCLHRFPLAASGHEQHGTFAITTSYTFPVDPSTESVMDGPPFREHVDRVDAFMRKSVDVGRDRYVLGS